jgi:hypothetical protein
MTEGRCLCGALRYEIDGPFVDMLHCHCSMCRKHHGAPYATWVAAPASGFRWTAEPTTLVSYASSAGFHRDFCSACGSVAPLVNAQMGLVIAPAGNLVDDPGIRPSKHMFVASRAPWFEISDDLPRHDEYPPEFGLASTPRAPVDLTPGVAQGSCLCGEVAYEISTPPLRMFYCHCSRCRQGNSAAHCANVFYKAGGFRWTRGADRVRSYRVAEAQYFGTAFCSRCGSAVPRVSTERDVAVVPAGSMDSDPGIAPAGHIFVDSRAAWETISDALPQFAEMPPRR